MPIFGLSYNDLIKLWKCVKKILNDLDNFKTRNLKWIRFDIKEKIKGKDCVKITTSIIKQYCKDCIRSSIHIAAAALLLQVLMYDQGYKLVFKRRGSPVTYIFCQDE